MLGSSRESVAALGELVAARSADAGFGATGAELLSVAALLARESSLRATLSDSGTPVQVRTALVRELLGPQVSADTVETVISATNLRWSSGRDLVDALEQAAAQVMFTVAERDGRIDRIQDELFKFGRAVLASGELQMALTDPALEPAHKAAIVRDLLGGESGGKVEPETLLLLEHVAANPRGRRASEAIDELVELASIRRERISAEVTSPVALDQAQQDRLAAALGRVYGREVSVNVLVDPSVLGGLSVRVDDEVIDGTTVHRLEQARRRLAG